MQTKNSFLINKNDINFAQTLSCGQIFSYKHIENGFIVFSADKIAKITEISAKTCKNFTKKTINSTQFNQNFGGYLIETSDVEYFKNFFDLNANYDDIKNYLSQFEVLKTPINFGSGIRILRQNLLEIIISFAISANNNIKRITNILFALRENFGTKIYDEILKLEYFSFPNLSQLLTITEENFIKLGTGYRAKQLVKLINQLNETDFQSWANLTTDELRVKLISLSGVGPKVADCILLFGYNRTDVFPVDTWIAKVFGTYFGANSPHKKPNENSTDKNASLIKNRVEMRKILTQKFGKYSGYAQQYLFFYARENKLQ